MKIGLVELVPNRTIVEVRANLGRSAMRATFVEEIAERGYIRVRSQHNGGTYLVHVDEVRREPARQTQKQKEG